MDAQAILGTDARTELELLVKWRVNTSPTDNSWAFETYFTNALGLADDYAGVAIAGFGTDSALINSGFTYSAWSDFYNSAPGYPLAMHGKDMWLRLLVDEYGVYARQSVAVVNVGTPTRSPTAACRR